MGFFNWMASLFSDSPPDRVSPGGGRAPGGGRSHDGGAVGTLEPPDDQSESETVDDQDRWWAPEGATLLEPVPLERPDLSVEARALEHLLISHFDGHDLAMPPIPRVAERVLAVLSSKKNSAAAVAQEIAQDQVIAASLIRMSNSPLYRGVQEITALQPAVARLGNLAIRTLMMHESLRAAMFQARGAARRLAVILWVRALAGAHIMRRLSEFTRIEKEEASLMGLLHDIGNVVVLRIIQSEGRQFVDRIDEATFEYLCFESHQEFGELMANDWKLPDRLKAIVSDHHRDPQPDDRLRKERLQLRLTDMILANLGYAPHVAYHLLDAPIVEELKLSGYPGYVRFLEQLPDELEEVVGAK